MSTHGTTRWPTIRMTKYAGASSARWWEKSSPHTAQLSTTLRYARNSFPRPQFGQRHVKPRINAVRPSRGGLLLASIISSPAAELAPPRPGILAAAAARPPLPQRRRVTALREHFEPQRACHRDRLHQFDGDPAAEAIGLAGRLAVQRVGGLVIGKMRT